MSEFYDKIPERPPERLNESDLPPGENLIVEASLSGADSDEIGEGPGMYLLVPAAEVDAEGGTSLPIAWGEDMDDLPEEIRGFLLLGRKTVAAAKWAWENKLGVLIATGVVGGVAIDPSGSIREAGPVAAALTVGEIAWVGGAAMCLEAVTGHVPRSWSQIREAFKHIGETAKNNPRFWLGLGINTAGALLEGAGPLVIIATHSPMEATVGKGTPFALDLCVTLAARGLILYAVLKPKKP